MCNRTDDMVHVSWMVYRLLGQWSCSSGVYHEPYAKGMFTFTNFLIVVISWVYIPASWQLFQMQKKMPPVGGLPISKGYYYALPVLVMGVIMLVMSAYKAIAFVITGDESICVPVEKEGGGLLD